MTEQERREIYTHPGGIAECQNLDWLLNGCPKCGCTEWQLTNDGWAYCDDCKKGYPLEYRWNNPPLVSWGKDGLTCFMCKGTKVTKAGEPCDECL